MAEEKKNEDTATTEAPKLRGITFADPESKTGEMITRRAFCRREVMEKDRDRAEVAKQLTEIEGRPVPYQIVFQATADWKSPRKAKEKADKEAAKATADAKKAADKKAKEEAKAKEAQAATEAAAKAAKSAG